MPAGSSSLELILSKVTWEGYTCGMSWRNTISLDWFAKTCQRMWHKAHLYKVLEVRGQCLIQPLLAQDLEGNAAGILAFQFVSLDPLTMGCLPCRRIRSEPDTSASSKEAFLSETSLYLKDKRRRTIAATEENQVKLWIQIAENQNLPQALRDTANRKIDRFLGN